MRNKLGRTITGAAVLALTATGAIAGAANGLTESADNASADVAESPSPRSKQSRTAAGWLAAVVLLTSGCAVLDSSGTDARKTAENWIKGFGAGARRNVTGDFYDDGSERQVVVLYFHDTRQVEEFTVRLDGDAGNEDWRVLMKSTDFKDATRTPDWVPKEPGGTGSRMKNGN
ncbi:hypothetical protein [Streptomyces adustus]